MKTKKPLMAFVTTTTAKPYVRYQEPDPIKKPRYSYVWRPGQKHLTREKSA